MKALISIGILALAAAACGKKQDPQAGGQESSSQPVSKSPTLTALGKSTQTPKSKPPTSGSIPSPATWDQQATPEDIARLEAILAKDAPAREARAREEARRVAEREKRVAEMTERMTARLREMDTNGDGLLAQEEMSGPFERRFAESDTNSDGFLDAAEQEAAFERMSERMASGSFGGRGGGGGRDAGGGRGGRGRERN